MQKVKFIRSHHEFAYSAGDIGLVENEKAAQLLNSGYIIILPEDEEDEINPLPEDFPARDILFTEGYEDVEKIKSTGESLIDIKGIGKGTLKQIEQWFTDNPKKNN